MRETYPVATREILLTHVCKLEQDTWLLESHLVARPREREERAAPSGNGGTAGGRKEAAASARR